jgi:acetyl-CoA synthetase
MAYWLDPEGFWGEHGKRIDWIKPYTKVKNTSFTRRRHIDQVVRGRHAQRLRQLHRPPPARSAATRSRSSGKATTRTSTRRSPIASCTSEVCKLRQRAEALGVKKGDRVTIYLPMIPEAAYAMLACARIGAIHSVVFGGFSPDSARRPHRGLRSKLVITADEGLRGGRKVPLKANTDEALKVPGDEGARRPRTGGDVADEPGRDVWYHERCRQRRPPTARPRR